MLLKYINQTNFTKPTQNTHKYRISKHTQILLFLFSAMNDETTKLTVKPFFGQYPISSASPTTETTQSNVLSNNLSSNPSDSTNQLSSELLNRDQGLTNNHQKSIQDLKMTDINKSISRLSISQKNPSMMSIDNEGSNTYHDASSSSMSLHQENSTNDTQTSNGNANGNGNAAADNDAPAVQRPTGRRKSTLILTEEAENDLYEARKHHDAQQQANGQNNNNNGASSINSNSTSVKNTENGIGFPSPKLFPVDIKWIQRGSKVYVTGSFTGWTKMIKLRKGDNDKEYSIRLNLPIGMHRFRFVVDNELRFSDYLPTATDSRGNFVNYIEILNEDDQPSAVPQDRPLITEKGTSEKLKQIEKNQQLLQESLTPAQREKLRKKADFRKLRDNKKDSHLGLTQDDDDMGNGYTRFHDKSMLNNAAAAMKRDYTYTNTIPAIFTDPQAMERYYLTLDQQNRSSGGNNQWLIPPSLPPHLDHVILNNQQQNSQEGGFNKEINAGGSLPIPNHVILNHLATTSIKHNTLAVATTVRYKRKYLTQILYAPIQ